MNAQGIHIMNVPDLIKINIFTMFKEIKGKNGKESLNSRTEKHSLKSSNSKYGFHSILEK